MGCLPRCGVTWPLRPERIYFLDAASHATLQFFDFKPRALRPIFRMQKDAFDWRYRSGRIARQPIRVVLAGGFPGKRHHVGRPLPIRPSSSSETTGKRPVAHLMRLCGPRGFLGSWNDAVLARQRPRLIMKRGAGNV